MKLERAGKGFTRLGFGYIGWYTNHGHIGFSNDIGVDVGYWIMNKNKRFYI